MVLSKCTKAEDACKVALEAKDAEVSLCKLGLDQGIGRTQTLERALEQKNDELTRFYRNPATMITLGAIVGILITGYAMRK